MEKRIVKVDVNYRLPTKDGLYDVELQKYKMHFVKGNKKCEKEWLERIKVWHEEIDDKTSDFIQLLSEMYNDLEVPAKYSKRIRNLINQ